MIRSEPHRHDLPERWAWAEVDLDAIAHNVGVVAQAAAPAAVWAVVKADAYGHGAVPVARAALDAGAAGVCVALTQEGIELRQGGIQERILVLSEQPPEQADELIAHRLTPTVYTNEGISSLVAAVGHHHLAAYPVHVKVDTGMHRVGVQPAGLLDVLDAVRATGRALRLEGLSTHLAVADEPDHPMNARQLERFEEALAVAAAHDHRPELAHAANSAAALALPAARFGLVRSGIALYGLLPGPGVADRCTDLRPALSLRARVSHVKRVTSGDGISYGLRDTVAVDTTVATLPLGYADGVPRRLHEWGEVLVRGRRRRILGVVTMDQMMIDCGDDPVERGEEVVLIGRQADEQVTADEWAARLGTIGYEVVCGISARIGRRYVRR